MKDSCKSCKYENEASDMYPCCDCCHVHESMWVKKVKKEVK